MGSAPAARLRRRDCDGLAETTAAGGSAPRPTEEAAFRALYARAAPRLLAYARSVGGGSDLADDVVQETFLRYLSAEPPPMTDEQTMAYLYRITTRLTIDRWRERERERRWLGEAAEPDALDSVPASAEEGLDLDLEAALARLKPRERALLWLAYVEGQPHREMARALDIATPSVRVLLFRARRRLAAILDATGLGPEGR